MKVRAPFDPGSLVVIAITLVLFAWALFEKGLTHDLLLEAGVFMVSVKLIIMSYKNASWRRPSTGSSTPSSPS